MLRTVKWRAVGDTNKVELGCCLSVCVIRPQLVLKNRVYRIEVARLRVQPRINVLRLDRHLTAVVPGLGNLLRRIVGAVPTYS